jgi:hypothetical protein
MSPSFFSLLLCASLLLTTPTLSLAQDGKSAVKAMDAIAAARKATGRAITKIAEISARGATPFPIAWDLKFYDPASPTYLTDLRPGERPEPSSHDYAEGKPPTYFDVTRVKLDVDKAFEVANKEAAIAKVGFDRLDYSLRAREFSQEPVWTLRLVNEEEQLVGTVELSAESGRVFRTIWLRRGPEPGQIRVIDSVLAAGGPTAASSASGASLENDLPALPPTPNLDPDAPANPAAPAKPESINVVEPVSPPKTP